MELVLVHLDRLAIGHSNEIVHSAASDGQLDGTKVGHGVAAGAATTSIGRTPVAATVAGSGARDLTGLNRSVRARKVSVLSQSRDGPVHDLGRNQSTKVLTKRVAAGDATDEASVIVAILVEALLLSESTQGISVVAPNWAARVSTRRVNVVSDVATGVLASSASFHLKEVAAVLGHGVAPGARVASDDTMTVHEDSLSSGTDLGNEEVIVDLFVGNINVTDLRAAKDADGVVKAGSGRTSPGRVHHGLEHTVLLAVGSMTIPHRVARDVRVNLEVAALSLGENVSARQHKRDLLAVGKDPVEDEAGTARASTAAKIDEHEARVSDTATKRSLVEIDGSSVVTLSASAADAHLTEA